MNRGIVTLLLLIFPFVSISNANTFSNSAKVTIIVLDESGMPLEDAIVGIGFEINTGWGTEATGKQGKTGIDGIFVVEGSCNGHITFGADKEGYYNSHYEYDFHGKGSFGWEPWNPDLKVVLRKIENPVPMYAKKLKIDLPALEKDIGYDLIAQDFTVPYGHGMQADLIFNAKKTIINKKTYQSSLSVRFSNKFDGIQLVKENLHYGSDLKLKRFAPIYGYLNQLVLSKNRNENDGIQVTFGVEDNYIFRIRSEEKDGNLERAMYGKILGPISFGNVTRRNTVTVIFKYYLNPDYTHNLEFDPKRNLHGPLPALEQVGIQ